MIVSFPHEAIQELHFFSPEVGAFPYNFSHFWWRDMHQQLLRKSRNLRIGLLWKRHYLMGELINWLEKVPKYFNFTNLLDSKNFWNCNIMKVKTMREEKTISSFLPWGRKCVFLYMVSSFITLQFHRFFFEKRQNFFFPIG